MDLFSKCVFALKNARSDTEKFAALLLVPKILKCDLPSAAKAELFGAIGANFIHRLFHTTVVPDECPPHVFKSVALSIMAAFCSDEDCDTVVLTDFAQEAVVLKELLQRTLVEDQVVDDVLCCLNRLASHANLEPKLIDAGLVDGLVERCLLGNHRHNECLHLLLNLLHNHPKECWTVSGESLSRLLFVQSASFKVDTTIKKFQFASYLVVILNSFPEDRECMEEWLGDIQEGLYGILTSRVFKEYRKPILTLICVLFRKFGPAMISTLHTSRKLEHFLTILLHIVCIEVQMILDETSVTDIFKETVILFSCYSILEMMLMVSNELWEMVQEHIEKLLSSLKMAFTSIITFLNGLAKEWEMWISYDDENTLKVREIAFATVRVLCSWMSEESVVLRKEICCALPFILKLVKDNANCTNQGIIEMTDGHKTLNLMQCLLPALCHLSADDNYRQVMIDENIPRVLLEYVQETWHEGDFEAEDFSSALVTSCGVFLNLVVMDGCAIARNEAFFEFFRFLILVLPKVKSKMGTKHLELVANFSVLGLLIARRFFGRLKSCEIEFHKFLATSVKFLWDSHEVVFSSCKTEMTLTREYQQVWPSIMEFWFLGMQALSSLLALVPWISVFLMESGWPQQLVSSFQKVDAKEVEDSVKSAYQEFLCSLVKSNSGTANQLLECGALQVSSIHNMKELEQVLNVR